MATWETVLPVSAATASRSVDDGKQALILNLVALRFGTQPRHLGQGLAAAHLAGQLAAG